MIYSDALSWNGSLLDRETWKVGGVVPPVVAHALVSTRPYYIDALSWNGTLLDRETWGGFPATVFSGGEQKTHASVISRVAKRQARDLSIDETKNIEELSRELDLEGLAWDASYFAELNKQRELLIDLEIKLRLKAIQDENNAVIIALLLLQIL